MKSESGLYFTKKLELAKDTHEFEPREGAPSGGPQLLSTQACASGDCLQTGSPSPGCASQRLAASPAGSVPFAGSRFPASPLAPRSWVSGLKSLCSPHFQFLLSTSLCSSHGCEHFFTSVPPALPSFKPFPCHPLQCGLFPHPTQYRPQRPGWACLGLCYFFQTFILPLSAEQSSSSCSWDWTPSTPLSHHLCLPSCQVPPDSLNTCNLVKLPLHAAPNAHESLTLPSPAAVFTFSPLSLSFPGPDPGPPLSGLLSPPSFCPVPQPLTASWLFSLFLSLLFPPWVLSECPCSSVLQLLLSGKTFHQVPGFYPMYHC